MDGMIYHVNKREYARIRELLKTGNCFVGEILGKKIQSLESFLQNVWAVFRFPQTGFVNYDAYLDWIRDLDWLHSDRYVFVIDDFGEFLLGNPELKKEIVEDLLKIVLPWWQEEVERYVVDGKAKVFCVYLVD